MNTTYKIKFSEIHNKYFIDKWTEILDQTWKRIPSDSHEIILSHLDYIEFGTNHDKWDHPVFAETFPNESYSKNYVIIDTSSFLKEPHVETLFHIIAHEFAHVYCNHPVIGKNMDDEPRYQQLVAEVEANKLTICEWKILPHQDDNIKMYQEFLRDHPCDE